MGLYLVYSMYHDDIQDEDYFILYYVGQSQNIRTRIQKHISDGDFDEPLNAGCTLFYSYAPVNDSGCLNQIENALIFSQQPILNDNYKKSYIYDNLNLNLFGFTFLLNSYAYMNLRIIVQNHY